MSSIGCMGNNLGAESRSTVSKSNDDDDEKDDLIFFSPSFCLTVEVS